MKDLSFEWRGKTRLERFLEKVRVDPSGCWIWTASIRPDGYGQIGQGPDGLPAVAQKALIGVPLGMVVHHKCRVRRCVRPDHMEFMSHSAHSRLHAADQKCEHGDARRNARGNCMECEKQRGRRRRSHPAYKAEERERKRDYRQRLAEALSSVAGY